MPYATNALREPIAAMATSLNTAIPAALIITGAQILPVPTDVTMDTAINVCHIPSDALEAIAILV
jgi:hypothetical protein